MMSDEELDRDWKPSGRRPQSTIARSFSQELMDIFRIENSVADLDEKVDKRKHTVQTQTTELEALEARIKEMEERLKRQSLPGGYQPGGSPRAPRPPVSSAFGEQSEAPPQVPAKDSNRRPASSRTQEAKHGSRPGTARASQQAVPGALPPTPTASEGEYEFEFVDAPSDSDKKKHNHQHQHQHQHQHPHIPVPQRRRPPRPQPENTITDSNTLLPEDPHQNVSSESESCADFVIVPGADGDGQRDS